MQRVQPEFLVADIVRRHALMVRVGDTQGGKPTNVPAGVLAQQRDTD